MRPGNEIRSIFAKMGESLKSFSPYSDIQALPMSFSAVFRGSKHGIGPNVACPTDSLYKLQLMHLGQAEEAGGLRLSRLRLSINGRRKYGVEKE